jgi:predicted O-methyltransferase YrrM
MSHRFEQIHDWLEENKPEVILEVGTWNGHNAIKMMECSGAKKYIGFDVWEEGSDALDDAEFNAKKRVTKKEVEDLLKKQGFDFELIRGNTRVTLPEYVKDKKPFVDFVLIDGGHLTATVDSDFRSVTKIAKTTGHIFFDDYYFGVSVPNVGCNGVLAGVNAPYTVMASIDPVILNKEKQGHTMVAYLKMKDLQITDRWDVPEKESWSYSPEASD